MGRVTSGGQLSCALLELIGLTMWIGGITIILVGVIPAVFNTLGMETGGRFLRRIFDGYNMLTSGIVILLISTAGFRFWKSRHSPEQVVPVKRTELGLLISLVIVTISIVLVLGPKAVGLQEAAFAAESQDMKKVAYDAFFRTHMIVRALHLINAGLAVSLLVVKFRQWVGTPGTFGYE